VRMKGETGVTPLRFPEMCCGGDWRAARLGAYLFPARECGFLHVRADR
jgi:hypothetical protein